MFIRGRQRREFTPEYKDEAVKLVVNTGRPVVTVARASLATVIDAHSRRVVGWAIAEHLRTDLVEDPLQMAITLRGELRRRAAQAALDHLQGKGWRRAR